MKGKARGGDAGRMDGRTSRQGIEGGRTRAKRATAERREGRQYDGRKEGKQRRKARGAQKDIREGGREEGKGERRRRKENE